MDEETGLMNAEEEYLLGALGDAYIDEKRNELQFYQKNLQWLRRINGILRRNFGVSGRIFKRDVYLLRKRNKRLIARIRELKREAYDGIYFVAGLFDSEGSVYLSTKSKIPVIDITQANKGLKLLRVARRVIKRLQIKSYLNGPYSHKNSKLPQYHLRIYGFSNCAKFCKSVPVKHPEKIARFKQFWTSRLHTLTLLR